MLIDVDIMLHVNRMLIDVNSMLMDRSFWFLFANRMPATPLVRINSLRGIPPTDLPSEF